ncbi:hypothetical protein HB4184_10495 [Pseudomonas putida]|nr:hypothetical protein HB4184_10495 [Pseudomonas putida]
MNKYEVKDYDGQVHTIEASSCVLDSNGLSLYVSAGVVAAIFHVFAWMRRVQAAVSGQVAGTERVGAEVVGQAGTGE